MPLDVKDKQNRLLTAATISPTLVVVSFRPVVSATAMEAAIVARSFRGFVDADCTAVKPIFVNLRSSGRTRDSTMG